MRLSILLSALFLVACVISACGGGSSSSSMSRSTSSSSTTVYSSKEMKMATADVEVRSIDEIPFEFSWDLQLPAPVHTSWVAEAIPDTLFVQTTKKQIHAIEIKSGHTKWVSRPLPKLMELGPYVVSEELTRRDQGAAILDKRLYVISDSVLFCIDANYGQIIWRFALPFEPSTAPYATGIGEGLRVFIGDWRGHLRVVTYHEEKGNPFVLWQWNLRGAPMADPIGSGGMMYIGNDRGVLDSFDHDRELRWSYNIGNTMRGAPVHRGRSLYFGSIDNVFHAVNRLSGQVMGQLYLDAPIERSPFIFTYDPKRVYLWTAGRGKDKGLYAIDSIPDAVPYKDTVEELQPLEVERLKVAWFVPGMSRLVAATKKHLFATYPGDATVYAINRLSGDVEWAWDVAASNDGKRTAVDLCEYVDHSGVNQSVISYDPTGKITTYKLFGQMGY